MALVDAEAVVRFPFQINTEVAADMQLSVQAYAEGTAAGILESGLLVEEQNYTVEVVFHPDLLSGFTCPCGAAPKHPLFDRFGEVAMAQCDDCDKQRRERKG